MPRAANVPMMLADAGLKVLAVDNDFCDNLASAISAKMKPRMTFTQPRRDVLEAVVDVVRRRGAVTAVLESEYVDADYLDAFSDHYSRAFSQTSSMCQRIHFFACEVTPGSVFRLSKRIRNEYLGYCVLRPTGDQYIGRTIVAPPYDRNDDRSFVHVTGEYESHLLGQQLRVRGVPFIQQDVNTFVCAGAALWTVAMCMHQLHRGPRCYPSHLQRIALERFASGHPRQGLTVEHMVMTLRHIGLNPYAFGMFDLSRVRDGSIAKRLAISRIAELIHVFVDSDLPPILAYDTHAVAVVGHDIGVQRRPQRNHLISLGGSLTNSDFVNTFYVMDDNRGPYASFHVYDTGTGEPSIEKCGRLSVVVPLPREVTYLYGDEEDSRHTWRDTVIAWNALLPRIADARVARKAQIEFNLKDSLVLRASLLDSRCWKRFVLAGSGVPEEVKDRYQCMSLPKFIWFVEISNWDNMNYASRSKRRICGEFLVDATANQMSPGEGLISFFAKGLFAKMPLANGAKGELMSIKRENLWYPPLRRAM